MWNLLMELLWRTDRSARTVFELMQEKHGRGQATFGLMLTGAGMGGAAMFGPYALVAFMLMWQVRAKDTMLVMLFLMAYVLIGIVQGMWLGGACGLACAFRAQRQRQKAGLICWLGGLPYVALLIGFFYTMAYTHRDAVKLLLWLCGLPLVWTGLLLLIGARLLYRP